MSFLLFVFLCFWRAYLQTPAPRRRRVSSLPRWAAGRWASRWTQTCSWAALRRPWSAAGPRCTSCRSGTSRSALSHRTTTRSAPSAPAWRKQKSVRGLTDACTVCNASGLVLLYLEGSCLEEVDLVVLGKVLEARDPLGKFHHFSYAGMKLLENSSQISWPGLQGSTKGETLMGHTWEKTNRVQLHQVHFQSHLK